MHNRWILAALLLAGCGDSPSRTGPPVAGGLLNLGTSGVEVLEMWSPPRMAALTQRVQTAIQQNPEWWQEHVRRAPPGQPIAYDARLGINEAEYREFLQFADSVRMRPARTDSVVVERTDTGWRFANETGILALRGIEVDTVRGVVRTSYGDLPAADSIQPTSEQRATGQWGGPRWSLEQMDTTSLTGVLAQFAVGRHENGRTVIFYDARRAQNGSLLRRESLFLFVLP